MTHGDPILRLHEVSYLLRRSVSSIHRDRKAGTFAPHIQLGANCVGWRLSAINAWIDARERGASVGKGVPKLPQRQRKHNAQQTLPLWPVPRRGFIVAARLRKNGAAVNDLRTLIYRSRWN